MRKFVPMPEAMKIPCKSRSVQRVGEARARCQHGNCFKKDVEEQEEKQVHFASLIDICHLKKRGVRINALVKKKKRTSLAPR